MGLLCPCEPVCSICVNVLCVRAGRCYLMGGMWKG